MAINFTTFFTDAGLAFNAGNVNNTAALTTVPTEVEDYVQGVTGSIDIHKAIDRVPGAITPYQSAAATLNDTVIRQSVRNLLVQMINDDKPQPSLTVSDAIEQLITQMLANSEDVDKSVVACTPSYGGSNVGDGVIVCSTKRGDGKINEHILAELIEGTVTSTSTDGTGTIELKGEFLAASKMAVDWPKGSAVNSTITSDAASGNNLINGTFETEDTESANLPLGWIAETATLGTTLNMTPVEVQTVEISGSPTGGFYVLEFTDRDGDKQSTSPINWNASSSAVQTALTALTGLGSVTVTTSAGAVPDITHEITFTDVPNPGELTNGGVGNLTGGTPVIAHVTTTAGSANVMRGARALQFTGKTGPTETTDIYYPLTSLTSNQQLAFNTWALKAGTPATGVMTISIVDGIGGSVINDDEGTANSTTITVSTLTTSYVAYNTTFRIPTVIPLVAYLRVQASTVIPDGDSVFFDEMILKEMDQLYSGGPSVAAFSGIVDWALTDTATVTTTNDRGGSMNEWMNRVFDLDTKDLLLPTATAPATQPDTLIS